MLKLDSLDEDISMYYDDEMKPSKLLEYEARMALSDCVRNYTNERCFEYFKISSSISRVNRRLKKAALLEYRINLFNKLTSEPKDENPNLIKRFLKRFFNFFNFS